MSIATLDLYLRARGSGRKLKARREMKDLKIQKKRSVCTRALFCFLINQEYACIHNFLLFLNDDLLSSLSLGVVEDNEPIISTAADNKNSSSVFPSAHNGLVYTDNHVSRKKKKVLYSL